MSDIQPFTQNTVNSIASSCPQLRRMTLHYCTYPTQDLDLRVCRYCYYIVEALYNSMLLLILIQPILVSCKLLEVFSVIWLLLCLTLLLVLGFGAQLPCTKGCCCITANCHGRLSDKLEAPINEFNISCGNSLIYSCLLLLFNIDTYQLLRKYPGLLTASTVEIPSEDSAFVSAYPAGIYCGNLSQNINKRMLWHHQFDSARASYVIYEFKWCNFRTSGAEV
jgi:hypothetical protein